MGEIIHFYQRYIPDLTPVSAESGTFWLFAPVSLSGFLFILAKLSQSMGKSLNEFDNYFTQKSKK